MPDPVIDRLRELAPQVSPPSAPTVARLRARFEERPAPTRRRRRLVSLPAALVLAVPLIYITQRPAADPPSVAPATGQSGSAGPSTDAEGHQWSAVALRVARGAPRLLVDGGGWRIARVNGWEPDRGELAYAHGDDELELSWMPLADKDGLPLERMADKLARAGSATVPGGRRVRIYKYRGQDLFIAGWRDGRSWLIARAPGPAAADFVALLGRLRRVDVDSWLGAMPASVVRPDDTGSAVAEMLRGVPVPDGLDVAAAVATGAPRDRYQLGAAVTGTVACAWIERLLAARTAGDEASASRATAALETARGWPILRQMTADGAFPGVVWATIDGIVDPASLPAEMREKLGAAPDSYRNALGCPAR